MDWIYNSRTGAVIILPKPFAAVQLKSGLGWHGPFNSKAEAIAFYNSNKAKNPGWKTPTTDVGDTIANIPESVTDEIGETVVDKLGFTNENITAWMIRIGEILLGIVLVGVGIAKLTGNTNAVAKLVKAKTS